MYEPAASAAPCAKGGDKHTVFRVGEVHGRITKRVEELRDMFGCIDSVQGDDEPVGRALVQALPNGMRNGVSAATGLTGADCDRNDAVRRFSIQLGGEAVRVGQALGYQLEKIGKFEPETLAWPPRATGRPRRGRGDPAAGSNSNRTRAPTSSARRWRRTSSRAAAPRSSS